MYFLADRLWSVLLPVHSMIGYWHHHDVRLSVRRSVCLSVMLCNVALRVGVGVHRAKSCTSAFLFVHSGPFVARMYRLTTKRTKIESKKTRMWDFRHNQACTGRVKFTDFVNLSQSLLSGLSLGAFINSPLNRIACTNRSSITCNGNRFDSLPVYCTS